MHSLQSYIDAYGPAGDFLYQRKIKGVNGLIWKTTHYGMKHRCQNQKNKYYRYYGGKGVKCLMSSEQLKGLFYRDKAWLLKQPSIDRIDSNGNYEIKNCRWIELRENILRAMPKKKLYDQSRDFLLNLDANRESLQASIKEYLSSGLQRA